ncbi:Ref family recombination enhancement nuclease [Pusillimonas noertemannii]|uniref:Phage RecA-dependent nuclease n=1 Tax=Pusillimonas noertemannii TaxID=305977 RepID=A0A2U1CMI2_9BURK|nr:Ref family recombination enhancement nuclease [Pusillimonas noertemannii]NYT68776.1 recombinase [Pusillimonas noertemannii]PVY62201.1 phage RecA-dependent nuclease [Pusillimonas noertemannii]TFL10815.1 recombinase [Pusillimonas noertemannii]
MKGRSVNAEEKRFHDMLASHIGCIACSKDGIFTSWVSIHHIDGRVKKNAHWWVLPLCGPHHQDAGIPGVIAVHPWKARFEKKYGFQLSLVAECIQILLDRGCAVPHAALVANGMAEEVAA